MRRVYLDHAATTAVHPKVLETMLPYLQNQFGNPSSIYSWGREAKAATENARAQVAALINAEPVSYTHLDVYKRQDPKQQQLRSERNYPLQCHCW